MNRLTWLLFALCMFGVVAQIAMWITSTIKLRRAKADARESKARRDSSLLAYQGYLPPVSVLKPLAGVDADLLENLRSFARQDYPSFELLFGVQSPTDPAIQVVRNLMAEFPGVAIKLVMTDGVHQGYNPKVNNLIGMIPQAAFEHMVISDSNVSVGADYLRSNIQHFSRPVVGVVTNLIRAKGGKSLGSVLESVHMNTFVLGSICLADLAADKTIVVGKSIFFRRSQMNQLGGLQRFANYLAEDYLMGRSYAKAGFEVVLSGYQIDTITTRWTVKQFVARHTRWAQLRWNINRPAYVAELATNYSFWSLMLGVAAGFSTAGTALFVAFWGSKVLGDMVQNRMLGRPLPSQYFLLSPAKDLLVALIFPKPMFSSKTNWRGTQLRVRKDSLLVAVEH